MHLLCCYCISTADIISGFTLFATCVIAGIAYCQLAAFNKTKRIEFTYQVDKDFNEFLNGSDNAKASAWLIDDEELKPEDWDSLRELLDKIEAIYPLMASGVIDKEIFYHYLSHYVECVFVESDTKKPLAKDYIQYCRDEAIARNQKNPDEIYAGLYLLLGEVHKMAASRPNCILRANKSTYSAAK